MVFPTNLHVCTYDMRGTIVQTGQPKPCRQTGLVVHTHQILAELTRRHPHTRLAITQTGSATTAPYRLRTPDGHLVLAQNIQTGLARYLADDAGLGKDPALVKQFYEDTIDDDHNPVYRSLAAQYTEVVHRAGSADVLAQNINPIVSLFKAEQFGYLDDAGLARLHLTGVIHDVSGAEARFDYLRRRLAVTRHSVHIVAVSTAVRESLLAAGLPADQVTTVVNGLDVAGHQHRVDQARASGVFDRVARRNGLPVGGRMVLLPARRVAWKGHHDLIAAVAQLADRGRLPGDVYVTINGHGLVDTRDRGYETELADAITAKGLAGRVFLLDDLAPDEVAACYGAAHIAVLPSRLPEAFGYANIEAMLAGVPVITTRQGGPLDYITHDRSGLLVDPGQPSGLADALDLLLSDPGQRDRIAAAGLASAQRFTVEAMFDGYAAIINAHHAAGVAAAGARRAAYSR